MVDAEKVNRMINEVRGKLSFLGNAKYKELNDNMAITFEEHFSFQNLKSEAQVTELITPDAAMIFYVALGEVHNSDVNGGWTQGTDLATKIITTQFMSELLTRKVKHSVRV